MFVGNSFFYFFFKEMQMTGRQMKKITTMWRGTDRKIKVTSLF